jgi:histidyl-tRNA synthetase
MLVLEAEKLAIPTAARAVGLDVFVAAVGAPAEHEAFRLLDRLRTAGLRAVGETTDRGLRAQMKQADRLGVRVAVILGEQELSVQRARVRDMRTGTQQDVPLDQLVSYLTTAAANGA